MIIKTLRFRLILLYALGVASLLITFGFVSYYSLQNSLLRENDKSLENYINSLEHILNPKLHPTVVKDKDQNVLIPKKRITELADTILELISQEIYEKSLLRPKNHFVQVFSPGEDTAIYQSPNIEKVDEDLPIEDSKMNQIIFKTVDNFHNEQIRLAVYKSMNYTIAIGSPLKETNIMLNNLFTIFSLLIPLTLILLIMGGWYLTRRSLKPIDDMTKIAREITTKDLHKRIKPSKHDDEIGRLVLTLNDMIDRLEKSFEKIQQFSADASHELRTPLTILIGELQNAIQKEKTAKEYQEIISNSIDEILVMSRIIDDLLTLYKADTNEINLQIEKLNLNEILSDLYEDTQIISMRKNIKVSINLKDQISVMGDKIRLRQLFLNLVENAIKYNKREGEIKIGLIKENDFACISIEDSGIGIPENSGDKIFDRFYRVDKSRARSEGGTGLGLSISKWIIEKHRGRIEYRSSINNGSCFSVYLPLST